MKKLARIYDEFDACKKNIMSAIKKNYKKQEN